MKLSDFWMPCCISVAIHLAILSSGHRYSDAKVVTARIKPAVTLNIVTSTVDRSSSPRVSHDASRRQSADPVYEQTDVQPQVMPESIRATESVDSRSDIPAGENVKPAEPIEQDASSSRPILSEESDTSVREETAEPELARADLPKEPVDVPSHAVMRDNPLLGKEEHISRPKRQPQSDETDRVATVRSEDADSDFGKESVQVSATLIGPCNPKYPRYSRIHGEEGTVVLSVEVLADGKIGEIQIVRSSGYSRPDHAAVEALEKATFIPAKVGDRPVPSITNIAFTFRLED